MAKIKSETCGRKFSEHFFAPAINYTVAILFFAFQFDICSHLHRFKKCHSFPYTRFEINLDGLCYKYNKTKKQSPATIQSPIYFIGTRLKQSTIPKKLIAAVEKLAEY